MYYQIHKKNGLAFSQGTDFNATAAEKTFKGYNLIKYKNMNVSIIDVPLVLKTGKQRLVLTSNAATRKVTMEYPYFDHGVIFKDSTGKTFIVCHSYIDDKMFNEVKTWAKNHDLKCKTIPNWYGFNTTAFILFA